MILEYLRKFGKASRKEVEILLYDKLSVIMTNEQKYNKVSHLLSALKKEGKIRLGKNKLWELTIE